MPSTPNEAGEIAALADRERIRELFIRLARGTDRVDEQLIRSCYAPDAIDEHGPFTGTGYEFAARPSRKAETNVCSHHLLGQSAIELDGDTAYCETYFTARNLWVIESGETLEVESMGRYIDRVERRDSEWLIAHRQAVLDWATERPATSVWRELDRYARGQRRPDDPVYRQRGSGAAGRGAPQAAPAPTP